jgi:hypothetical protein
MSLDAALRSMIRDELALQLKSVHELIDALAPLRGLAAGLAPYTGVLAGRRRPGRPPSHGPSRGCAVIGCSRASRSKGYCAAHYQKLRNLIRTHRRPSDWKDDASPATVQDVVLPRGRAAAKALRAAKRKGAK